MENFHIDFGSNVRERPARPSVNLISFSSIRVRYVSNVLSCGEHQGQ